jgi:hypothetical protein
MMEGDLFNGEGKYVYPSGEVYEGHWRAGSKEGLGRQGTLDG